MRKLYLSVVVLALAALPAAAAAQQNMPPRRAFRREMAMGMLANPASRILDDQSNLNLTSDQMEKLAHIRDHFRDENREDLSKAEKDWRQITAKYGRPPYSPETQEKVRHERQEMRKHYAKLFDNETKARHEAMEVLSASQRERFMTDSRGRMLRPDRH